LGIARDSVPEAGRTSRRLRLRISPRLLDMLAVTFAGALIRLGPALVSPFPLHDGGFFVVMIRDIRAAGMTLPATTSYNGGGIPFDYPPLALWLAAVLPVDPLMIVQFAGPLAAVLTVPMVYKLALELLPGRPYAYVSALLYAVVPRGWDWLVAGGSVTRAPGLLLALVGIWMMLRVYRRCGSRYVVGAGLCGGLAVVTHPEAGVLVAVAFGLLALVHVRSRGELRTTIWVAVGVCVPVLPWLALLASRGSLQDLLHAGSLGANPVATAISLFRWDIADEILAPAVLALGLIGALALARRRWLFIVIWLLTELGLSVRGAATYACIPLSLAASVGLYDAIGRGILRIPRRMVFHSNAVRGILLMVLAWSAFNIVGIWYAKDPPFDGLSSSGLDTMAWVKANTPADSRFVVVSGQPWPNDAYGEWLPALTDRVSLATVQGREWASRATWDGQVQSYNSLQRCIYYDAECVASWAAPELDKGPVYVYLVDSVDSHALLMSVKSSHAFQVVRESDEGIVALLVGT
jgi:hypothetical protein